MVAALTASGLPTHRFRFVGFLPVKSGQRRRALAELIASPETVVLYESPFRTEKLLQELAELAPERRVVVARELTKRFEEHLRGTAREVVDRTRGRAWKGEVTVVLDGAESVPRECEPAEGAGEGAEESHAGGGCLPDSDVPPGLESGSQPERGR